MKYKLSEVNITIQFNSQYQNNTCHKLNLDQYYTPDLVALECVKKTISKINNITEFFETSAGAGAFVRAIKSLSSKDIPLIAVDLEPKFNGILQQDFLDMPLSYKKGRCFIGNPPFGARLALAQKFWKRCVYNGDYVAWILPISQFNNNVSMYEFDLIYSEDLDEITFSGIKPVRCCFNIYQRPCTGLNNRPSNDLNSVSFMRSDSKNYKNFNYDFRMCCWGGRAGQLLKDDEPDLAMVYKIKVNNPELKEKVKNILEQTDWSKERPSVSCKKVQKAVIVKVLKSKGVI